MSKLYIASEEVTGHEIGDPINREHLYLVYDPNNIIDGDELVIRGGPFEPMELTGPFEADHGNIFIDAARPLVDSDDAFQAASTPENPGTRNFTELKLLPGQTTDLVWSQLVNYAKTMGTYDPATQRVETPLDYSIGGPNSNSTIGSILSGGAGINIHDTLPRQFGPGGATVPANVFTGLEHYYVSGGGTKTIVISDSHTKTLYDSGTGDTTVVLDANKIGAGGITLFSDSLAGTLDRVVLKGVDPANILLWTYNGNDLWIEDRQGHVLAKLMGQLNSANKFNGLDVEKPDGTLVHFALPQTEQDIAVWTPSMPLPDWMFAAAAYQSGSGGYNVSWGGGGGWYGVGFSCPLVLDLDGDGVETSRLGWGAAGSRTYFDMDNDGFAERAAWIAGGDGVLARDRNGNGKIDDRSELFGNGGGFADGFAALRALDSNADNAITAADTNFSTLRVWVDSDKHNQRAYYGFFIDAAYEIGYESRQTSSQC